jgi:hypothetical protein
MINCFEEIETSHPILNDKPMVPPLRRGLHVSASLTLTPLRLFFWLREVGEECIGVQKSNILVYLWYIMYPKHIIYHNIPYIYNIYIYIYYIYISYGIL